MNAPRRPAAVAAVLATLFLPAPPAALRAAPAPPAPAPAAADTTALAGLPLVELPPAAPGGPAAGTLAIVLTGDGDWAELVQGVARTLADGGAGVVGLKARAYLTGAPRTPDATAADVARIARAYLARWGARRLALVGYSRGADLLPFVASRLPADLRDRVAVVAMLGLAPTTSFEFHWSDLVRDTARPTDLPVAPELVRLRDAVRGARLLCVYGTAERASGCRDADPSLVTRVARAGEHHFDGDFPALGRLVLDALPAARGG